MPVLKSGESSRTAKLSDVAVESQKTASKEALQKPLSASKSSYCPNVESRKTASKKALQKPLSCNVVYGGKTVPNPEETKKNIETAMSTKGYKDVAELPYKVREAVNNVIAFYKNAGRNKLELDGLRFALGQILRNAIGHGERAGSPEVSPPQKNSEDTSA